MPKTVCDYCGGHADLLCDSTIAWLGMKLWNRERSRKKLDAKKHYTCDASICRSCATHKGSITYSFGHDTIDVCPYCAEREEAAAGDNRKLWIICVTLEEVKDVRRAHNAARRRWWMKRQKPVQGGGQITLDL